MSDRNKRFTQLPLILRTGRGPGIHDGVIPYVIKRDDAIVHSVMDEMLEYVNEDGIVEVRFSAWVVSQS